ncbi:MAG: radical SAM protein [Gemmatimonadaceae bacterium]
MTAPGYDSKPISIDPAPAVPAAAASPRRRPLDLGFELSNLCNLHCTHCIRGSHQARIDRLDLPFVLGVIDEARELFAPVEIVFTGGEPLAAELFPAIVNELRTRSLSYRFVTNGWLIPRHLATLLGHPPSFVRISLSGATEHTHDAQRGRDSFRRALLGASVLLSRGIVTELSMVVARTSRAELGTAARLATDLGVGELHFILPQPTPETACDGSDLSPDEWDDVATEVRVLAASSSTVVKLDYGSALRMPRPRCNTMALRQLYVDALGRVPFCCQLSRYGSGAEPIIGDLHHESLATVVARAEQGYNRFDSETTELHRTGRSDRLDDYPCLSCARRHGRTGFLADHPSHPWTALARSA